MTQLHELAQLRTSELCADKGSNALLMSSSYNLVILRMQGVGWEIRLALNQLLFIPGHYSSKFLSPDTINFETVDGSGIYQSQAMTRIW